MTELTELNELRTMVRKVVREELKQHKTSSRRPQNLIRDLIQEELDKRPKNKHELKKAVDADKRTVGKALDHLQDLGVVSKYKPDTEEVSNTTYYRLNN